MMLDRVTQKLAQPQPGNRTALLSTVTRLFFGNRNAANDADAAAHHPHDAEKAL
jgi:hypothetical protein